MIQGIGVRKPVASRKGFAAVNAALQTEIGTNANGATSVLRTLVLCDLVDSTALVARLGDRRASEVLREHDRLVRALSRQHGGREID